MFRPIYNIREAIFISEMIDNIQDVQKLALVKMEVTFSATYSWKGLN